MLLAAEAVGFVTEVANNAAGGRDSPDTRLCDGR